MNPYIFCPIIDLDYNELNLIVERQTNMPINDIHTHHRIVEHEPYLRELRQKYPILSGTYNLYEMVIPLRPHIDIDRQAALNIPIRNSETTVTTFYNNADTEGNYDLPKVLDSFNLSDLTPVYCYRLNSPIIINTKIPHGVRNVSSVNKRTSISWSFLPEVTFEQAVKYFSVDAVSVPTL